MVTIELYNLYSKITGIDDQRLMNVLDQHLSVETPGANFSASFRYGNWDGRTRFGRKYKNTMKFPTGLLTHAVKAIKRMKVKYEIIDCREDMEFDIPAEIKLADPKLGEITLRDYQYEAVVNTLEASRGIVNIATNGGKTEVACGIMKIVRKSLKEGQRIAFFTHSQEIFTQSIKRLEKRLGEKVGKIGGGKWDEQQITVVMIPTIQQYMEPPKKPKKTKKMKDYEEKLKDYQTRIRNGEEELKDEASVLATELTSYKKEQLTKASEKHVQAKTFLDSVVCFLADECHHASSDTWYKLFMGLENAYIRVGLTGTIDEKYPVNVMRLFGCTGRITKKVSNAFLIEQGYSAKPTINMISYKADVVEGRYADANQDGLMDCVERNEAYIKYLIKERELGNQCLIIVNKTEHGKIVSDMLNERGIEHKFTHGNKTDKFREKTLQEFSEGKLSVLIATTILDEGVDISNIEALFLMGGGKSMRQQLQRIGRGLRAKADGSGVNVYDSLDYHNEYLVEHTAERYNVYKEEGFDIKKVQG